MRREYISCQTKAYVLPPNVHSEAESSLVKIRSRALAVRCVRIWGCLEDPS